MLTNEEIDRKWDVLNTCYPTVLGERLVFEISQQAKQANDLEQQLTDARETIRRWERLTADRGQFFGKVNSQHWAMARVDDKWRAWIGANPIGDFVTQTEAFSAIERWESDQKGNNHAN